MHSNESERLCCRTSEIQQVNKRTVSTEMDMKNRWSSDYYKNARQRILNGEKLEICSDCFDKEEKGGHSDRIRYNSVYRDFIKPNIDTGNQYASPLDLDIRPSNLCNLKCRMCGPSNSSQIYKEFSSDYVQKKYGTYINKEVDFESINIDASIWNLENEKYLLHDNLKKIKLLGGEPSIMPETESILDYLISVGKTDVNLHITTNLTNSNKKFIDKLSKFSNLEFNYSIDGIGDVVEYIRTPVTFEAIEKNIKIYESLGNGEIICTVQALNLFNMIDILEWADSINVPIFFNSLEYPRWASVYNIPKDVRDRELKNILKNGIPPKHETCAKKNIAVLEQYLACDETYDPTMFVLATKALDDIRDQKLKDSIPEIWELFKDKFQ
jgi:MoaA/NifB/PqqE/SkfB family radical SAM enzyme